MKLYRVLNEATKGGRTELVLTEPAFLLHPDHRPIRQIVMACMSIILPKYGETVKRLVAESVPGVMNYMLMPAVLDSKHALVIDLYIDWMDEAEKIAGKVRPTYQPHVLVTYYLCTPGELKSLHNRVQNEVPDPTDLTLTKEIA